MPKTLSMAEMGNNQLSCTLGLESQRWSKAIALGWQFGSVNYKTFIHCFYVAAQLVAAVLVCVPNL